MRLLIIEDNLVLCASMKKGLTDLGYLVDASTDGEEGEAKAFDNDYDYILLDLNLPGRDGLDILHALRHSGISTPVLILTARDKVEEKAKGLDQGADDYLIKPFEMIELRARIQALIRRSHGRTSPVIQIGGLRVDPRERTVHIQGRPLLLSGKEFDILEYLSERAPAAVTSEELVEHVYGKNFAPQSSVFRVHIAKLRRKIQEACGEDLIMKMRGSGYILCEKKDKVGPDHPFVRDYSKRRPDLWLYVLSK